MTGSDTATAVLTIDLGAIARNFGLLRDMAAPAECAAVVKADAYGLGVERVAPVLAEAGCRTYFVATVGEGISLAAMLRRQWPECEVHILGGLYPGAEATIREHRLIPALNSLQQIDAWRALGDGAPPADIHVDTGMSRLGLPADEVAALTADPGRLAGMEIRCLMSHLACGDEPDHPMNRRQLAAFRAVRDLVPGAKAAFSNSAGVFLGPDFHLDLVRPGIALYGVNPLSSGANPMVQVVKLKGKILQVRDVDTPQTVGYGASHCVTGPIRVATVGVGYADGFLRSLSNVGCGYVGDTRLPLVGRVSMDLITLDVSGAPSSMTRPGDFVDLIGPHNTVDAVAAQAGTIGYEVLTRLGRRFHRVYLGA